MRTALSTAGGGKPHLEALGDMLECWQTNGTGTRMDTDFPRMNTERKCFEGCSDVRDINLSVSIRGKSVSIRVPAGR